ncbi:MAG: ATP-dependent nuclease, partial [Promethearchaeota archaeon]
MNGSKCHILLGINETGKSNILKAIALLGNEINFDYEKDCNKNFKKENPPMIIDYQFELNDEELKKIKEILLSKEFPKELCDIGSRIRKKIEFTYNNNKSNNNNFIKREKWIFSFQEKINYTTYSVFPNDERIIPSPHSPPNSIKLTEEKFHLILHKFINQYLAQCLPKVVYWKYSDNFLITKSINLQDFKNNPNISIPLRNIFKLNGLEGKTLVSSIDRAMRSPQDRMQLEEELTKKITEYINQKWPEYKISIKIRIEKDGFCEVSVKDEDKSMAIFRMDERSDGFKQFISILLSLSVENKNKDLNNALILLDEPEISLHPSSVYYLRDELLKIAEKNIIFIASHSIFIIDKKNLNRHIKVLKEDGNTRIEWIKQENPFAEEIIYRALGTSIYEIIQPYILIFEGTTDKDTYDAFLASMKNEEQDEDLSEVQTIAASGVNSIPKYAKFFNQKTVTGIIVVDSDKKGRNVAKDLRNKKGFEDRVFEIKDLVESSKKDMTLEDLFPESVISSAFSQVYEIGLCPLKNDEPFLKQIKEYKDKNNIKKYDLKKLKEKIVRIVIEDINNDAINIKE